MGRLPDDLSFEAWVEHIFAHPGTGPEWYTDIDADFWDPPADRSVDYLRRLFLDPVAPLSNFSDEQLNRGFWYLLGSSGQFLALLDFRVPLERRLDCLRSFHSLAEKLFATRCTPHLSHLDEPGAGPLNSACYMWWDILPFYAENPAPEERAAFNETVVETMERTLGLASVACQEQALHGLGHWAMYCPVLTQPVVDRFLKSCGEIRPELRRYAESAAGGCVL